MKVYQRVAKGEFNHVVSRSVFRTADEANGYLSNFRTRVTERGKGRAVLGDHNLSFHVLELELV
jgi:hypothetical protein